MHLASRGEGKPEATCQNLSLSSVVRPPHRHRPPMDDRHSCWTPSPTPRYSDRARHPSCTLGVAIAGDGRRAWSERHRPPPGLSPRRQTCLDPMG
jgi:hypothetical protein